MSLVNDNYCKSVKSKNNLNIQCQYKHKFGELFCGKHLNSTNAIIYKESNIGSKLETTIDESSIDVIIYDKNKLFELVSNNSYISVCSLRKSIKKSDLKYKINTKQSKQLLLKSLKIIIEEERYYISNMYSIIAIQSIFRKWLVYRKKICCNDTDILTFSSKYDIPNIFFYIFNDNLNNKKYAYDIRTLYQIIESDYPSCPYTFRQFTEEEKNEIILYKNKLNQKGINIDIPKNILSHEEEIDMKIKDIFYQINMLDNYTNPDWFRKLNLNQLIHLYVKTEDIWNYRSCMDIETKKKIVTGGQVFNAPLSMIKTYKSKIKLQEIILNDYLKLITEGINREEKKLGAILILTGLVEVSIDAAEALPYLVQL